MDLTTVIIDFAGPYGLVSGARDTSVVDERTGWRHGVAVGLTPGGVSALFGVSTRDLVGTTVPLGDLLGHRAVELAERLGTSPDWASRFALINDRLTAWLRPHRSPDGAVTQAWWRLQESAGLITIGGLAGELGVSRRRLESGFRTHIGLPPKTVARIVRFQRAVRMLGGPSTPLETAIACGYADQPHFNREIRAMTGITPARLFASLQYSDHLAD